MSNPDPPTLREVALPWWSRRMLAVVSLLWVVLVALNFPAGAHANPAAFAGGIVGALFGAAIMAALLTSILKALSLVVWFPLARRSSA